MNQTEINTGNDEIAKYLGWFTDEDQKGSWFVIDGCGTYVAYSIHNNYPNTDLPFFRDWNWLMKVVDKIEDETKESVAILPVYFDDLNKFRFDTIVNFATDNQFIGSTYESRRDSVWKAVIEYVKWFNADKQ